MKASKICLAVFYILSAICFVWLAASYVDVITHQQCGGTDAAWNFFVMSLNK